MRYQHHLSRIVIPQSKIRSDASEFEEVQNFIDNAVNYKGYELVSVATLDMMTPSGELGVAYTMTFRRPTP